jgi:hypothetical protein
LRALAAAMRTGIISGSGRISVSPGPPGAKVQNTEEFCPFKPLIKLGSLHDICKELGVSEGKNKKTIKASLYQNASAFITAKIHYKSGDGTERVLEAGFTRYNVIFTGEKLPDGRRADGVYIILNDIFIQVINGAMTRPLDYSYLKSLPPAPQRFYELLSYQMYAALKYDRPSAKLIYSDFCDHAPQTRHEDWDRVRSQMNKIHRPHRESGYIADIEWKQTTDRNGKPDWSIHYQPGPKARAEYKAFNKRGGPTIVEIEPLEDTPPALPGFGEFLPNYSNPIVQDLIDRGVSPDAAAKLEATYLVEDIQLQIEHFDWLKETKHKLYPDNPGGWFIKAVPKKYTPPPQFKTKAKHQQDEEVRKEKQRQAAEVKRIKKEKETREEQQHTANKAAAEAYLADLTPEERIDQRQLFFPASDH